MVPLKIYQSCSIDRMVVLIKVLLQVRTKEVQRVRLLLENESLYGPVSNDILGIPLKKET